MKAEKKYGDTLLFSWGLIEQEIDAMLRQLGYGKDRVDRMRFNEKVRTLLDSNYFTEEDGRKVSHFKQKRDAVFHSYTLTMMWASEDDQKDRLADIAIDALKACTDSFMRNMKPVRQTDTVREYFLNYETIEPNEFREPTTKNGTI